MFPEKKHLGFVLRFFDREKVIMSKASQHRAKHKKNINKKLFFLQSKSKFPKLFHKINSCQTFYVVIVSINFRFNVNVCYIFSI